LVSLEKSEEKVGLSHILREPIEDKSSPSAQNPFYFFFYQFPHQSWWVFFHFFEVNRALRFDRPQAFGMRLNVPAGTAVRFEPGDEKRVTLVELAGARKVFGLNGLTEGAGKDKALAKLAEWERRR